MPFRFFRGSSSPLDQGKNPEIASALLLLSRLGFATDGPCEIQIYPSYDPDALDYDHIAVGWMHHHRVDDGTGHAGVMGFAVQILLGTAIYPEMIPAEVAKDHVWYAAVAKRAGKPLMEILQEAAKQLKSGGTLASDNTAPSPTAETTPSREARITDGMWGNADIRRGDVKDILDRYLNRDIPNHEAISKIVALHTKRLVQAFDMFESGELTTDELISATIDPESMPPWN